MNCLNYTTKLLLFFFFFNLLFFASIIFCFIYRRLENPYILLISWNSFFCINMIFFFFFWIESWEINSKFVNYDKLLIDIYYDCVCIWNYIFFKDQYSIFFFYKCLWSVGGKSRGSSLQKRVSYIYILRLCLYMELHILQRSIFYFFFFL